MDCSQCVFAITENNDQVGCEANRIDILIQKGKAEKVANEAYYKLSQFCNMYRSEECSLEKARSDIQPLFGIVIHHDKSRSLDDVQTTINSIMNIDYPRNKIKIIISSPHIKEFENLLHLTNVVKSEFKASELVLHLQDDVKTKDTECFKKLIQATYFVKIASGKELQPNTFKKIDRAINDELKQICMFDTDSATVIMKKIMTEVYLHFNNYDLASEHIKNLSIEQGKYEKI